MPFLWNSQLPLRLKDAPYGITASSLHSEEVFNDIGISCRAHNVEGGEAIKIQVPSIASRPVVARSR